MNLILPIAAGGALGAVARYALASAVQRGVGGSFPWGTLVVNILGALAMGLVIEGAARVWSLSVEMRAFLTTGVLGGFTTFSAFSLETTLMLQRDAYASAAAYIAASVLACVGAVFVGMALIRSIAP